MSYEERKESISREAAGDLSAAQFKFVVLNGSGQVAVAGTQGIDCLGVLQNKPSAQGQAATVTTGGTTKIVAGAAVAVGATVMTDASGRAITATSTNKGLGTAMEAASAAGQIIPVNLEKVGTI